MRSKILGQPEVTQRVKQMSYPFHVKETFVSSKVIDGYLHKLGYTDPITHHELTNLLIHKHNVYAVIMPTVEGYWTFKIITVSDKPIEIAPYKNVSANDYYIYGDAFDAASIEMLKQILERK